MSSSVPSNPADSPSPDPQSSNPSSAPESAVSESTPDPAQKRRREEEWWAIVLALVAMLGIFWWVTGRDRFPIGEWISSFSGIELADVADAEVSQADGEGGDRPNLLGDDLRDGGSDPDAVGDEDADPSQPSPAKKFSWQDYISKETEDESDVGDSDADANDAAAIDGATAPKQGETNADGQATGNPPPPPAQDGALDPAATPLPSAPPAPQAFDDVPDDHWAAPFVNQVTKLELIEGFPDNTFRPDEPVTRAQLAAVVAKAYRDRQAAVPATKFSDVGADFWGLEAIGKTVQIEFMKGYPDSTFNPEKPLPRLEALLTFVAGLKLEPKGDPDVVLGQFPDGDQVPDWARRAIAAAVENRLLSNPKSKTLDLSTTATRADIAAIVYQALLSENKVGAVDSPHILDSQQ